MNRFTSDFASAVVSGSNSYPSIKGMVTFTQHKNGVIVTANISGLPFDNDTCKNGILAFHIHEGATCTGNESDPFADVMGHYNPGNCEHPYHAGDLPPLFSNNGHAYLSVLTNRFTVREIIGRTIIIHRHSDDFMTQPSGNAGEKIACGVIGA